MSVSGGKYKALERGKELTCESIQVFVRNVRGWQSKPLEKKEIDKYLETREQLRSEIWPVLSHNSYLINLATSDEEKLEKSHNAMFDELVKANQLKIDHVVMHPGTLNKHDEKETEHTALARIATQLNSLLKEIEKPTFKILLETTAGQGNNLGKTFEELKYIMDLIEDKDKIGVCFDTCHAFAAGYDFTTPEKYEQLWDEFDSVIGLKYLFAFHLNDSEKELGSRVDRHIHIGQGKIGKKPFGFFVNDERFKNHPGILETPKGKTIEEDKRNLEILRSLIEKK
ncbi:MAG: deoxyribonuclease IV [Promethearchaeota archaeon]